MANETVIIVEGVVKSTAARTTNGGKHLLEVVVDCPSEYRGQTYHDWYPVTFWEERIPEVAEGDAVRVEARVRGDRNQTTGRAYARLVGMRCEKPGEAGGDDAGGDGPAPQDQAETPAQTKFTEANDPLPF